MKKWIADTDHSELSFGIKHLMLINTTGKIEDFEVEVVFENENIGSAQFQVWAALASINTLHEVRDERLRGEDFLNVANYPELSFQSEKLRLKEGENVFELVGELQLKGKTNRIKLKAVYTGTAMDSYSGETKMGWQISGKIDRRDWGINFNLPFEGEGVAVGNLVHIKAEIECVKEKEA